jgi:hypothetical protein
VVVPVCPTLNWLKMARGEVVAEAVAPLTLRCRNAS